MANKEVKKEEKNITELPKTYRQWTLAKRPTGVPTMDDFKLKTVEMPNKLERNQILVQIEFLSVDPYMRGSISNNPYALGINIGDVMVGSVAGVVVKSENTQYPIGQKVMGHLGWQEYAVSEGNNLKKIPSEWELSYTLGVLGMPGATAYLGFFDICLPKPGETVFVTGAAGAVGSLVGQLAKIAGCKVIGSVGNSEKVKFCKDLGFDEVLIYSGKDLKTLDEEVKKVVPQGIDCFFENTGGPMSDAVFKNMNKFGRVSICGQISQYNSVDPDSTTGLPVLSYILRKQLKVEGWIISSRWSDFSVAHNRLFEWIKNKKLIVKEDFTNGFDKMPDAFLGLFSGKNVGKAVVKV
jgi:NADPH-dependent curcumin reductase CurA